MRLRCKTTSSFDAYGIFDGFLDLSRWVQGRIRGSSRKGVGKKGSKNYRSRCYPLLLCSIKTQQLHSMKSSESDQLELLENQHADNDDGEEGRWPKRGREVG